jgi:zinc transporter ZupT
LDGFGLLALGAVVAAMGLVLLEVRAARRTRSALELSVAGAIGLHNLGEGLAVGAAIALGEVAAGAALVTGFTLQKVTEGISIGIPAWMSGRPHLGRLGLLVAVAGLPAIIGIWLGGLWFSPSLAALALGLAVGALTQVTASLLSNDIREGRFRRASWLIGLAIGMILLYAAGFLV